MKLKTNKMMLIISIIILIVVLGFCYITNRNNVTPFKIDTSQFNKMEIYTHTPDKRYIISDNIKKKADILIDTINNNLQYKPLRQPRDMYGEYWVVLSRSETSYIQIYISHPDSSNIQIGDYEYTPTNDPNIEPKYSKREKSKTYKLKPEFYDWIQTYIVNISKNK